MATYSFKDVNFVISHPSVGQFPVNGQGIGTITISMATDRTAHSVAADGRVMPSLVAGRNGTIAVTIQQTSGLHHWLIGWANYLENNPGQFADSSLTLHTAMMGDAVTCQGVTHQKIGDRSWQAQGQLVTWNLMATDVQHDN